MENKEHKSTEKMKMKHKNQIAFLPLQAIMIFLLFGCQRAQDVTTAILPIGPTPAEANSSTANRFDESEPKTTSPVESAIELSGKYAELSEAMVELKNEKHELLAQNQRLRDRLAVIEPKLEQAQKELAQANDLLLEMRVELNNWKADVLGFREEIRTANTAQLEALFKILKVLGGEVATETTRQGDPVAAMAPANGPAGL